MGMTTRAGCACHDMLSARCVSGRSVFLAIIYACYSTSVICTVRLYRDNPWTPVRRLETLRRATLVAMSRRGKRAARDSVDARPDALLREGRPRRHVAAQGTTRPRRETLAERGDDAFTWLQKSGASVDSKARRNNIVLGIAAALELDRVEEDMHTLLHEADLDHRNVRHSLHFWRKKLADAAAATTEEPAQRQMRLRPKEWQLLDTPGEPPRQAAHWRPPTRGRNVMGARTFTSVDETVAWLRRNDALADAVVRADGAEQTTMDVLCEWPYVSVHLMKHTAAEAVVAALKAGWLRPAWATTLAQDARPTESLVAIFLTTLRQSRCSLHWDAVDSVWLVTAGRRELWVLPPFATVDALPDCHEVGREPFSDYDPWKAGADRHAAWRCVTLGVGDWVYMPRGWWHIAESSPGSVMINLRV